MTWCGLGGCSLYLRCETDSFCHEVGVSNSGEKTTRKCSKQLAAIDQLLIAGIKQGPAKKRDAINRILELVPGWTREDCWERIRHLRKTPEFVGSAEDHPNKPKTGPVRRQPSMSPSGPWTPAHDGKLLQLAGYEPVDRK